ncbi:MAG TPA: nucleotidyl transferase AbiEii/AbiGii toxin family protein [Mesotoga infera]|uniref:Nucleotidyl transferase AbiEii/AbiGii toxin family protein n=1 Tax=Mesotoga infera TaxID=1236046 RepID=A0A7C1CVJ0_9BACT|nr:nucleotidyl transferase AbiEii/AbiGii toxin family protein [Mesotoga infera]
MRYDKQTIGQLASELGFVRDTFEKVLRLVEVLQFIDSDNLLSEALALKGGTAINLFIMQLARLSVDIDLDYCKTISKETMIEDRPVIIERIALFMSANGYRHSDKSKRYYSLESSVFEYTNSGGARDNIKIEINFSMRAHVLPVEIRSTLIPGILQGVHCRCVDPIEILASKIVALLTRAAVRDLYDANRMISHLSLSENDKELLRKCILFYFSIGSSGIPESLDFAMLKRITEYRIRTELLPVLRKTEKIDLDEILKGVEKFLSNLLVFTARESKFIDKFGKRDYNPELLFDDSQIVERIKHHPMALWKTNNENN